MSTQRPSLLIVEDEAAHVEAIRRAYEDAGVEVEIWSVETLREFRASIQERRPDLALIDLNLPDGRAVEALTHPPEDAPFPVLVMTAFGNQQTVVEVIKAGALDYVVKSPAAFATMPRTVEHALREWGLLQKHKQAEDRLRASEEKFRAIANYTVDWESWFGVDGKYLWVNPSVERFTGYSAEEVLAMPDFISVLIAEEDWDEFTRRFQEALRGSQGKDFEFRYLHKNGGKFWLSVSWRPIFDAHGNSLGVRASGRDITARKRTDEYREMGRTSLQILNEPGDLQSSIHRVLAEMKMRTGADAVGIRLQEGDDFPYLAQSGFSADFLQTENTLVARGADGGLCRDSDGHIKLECTCGLVISGKTDPANPLFTPGGSFWTNDSFPLLDLPPDQDPRFRPRNECTHQGYASVALVPIRNKDRIVGLIHLNDRRKGFFTLEEVELLEGIASHLGEVLMRRRAEDALRESQGILQAVLNSIPVRVFWKDRNLVFLGCNAPFARDA
ncbi:MAG: PAS domain S-box protein, partial [Verrucomicrobia bacterium]|nr:PAS domain S-box protein [Verrucomicrobiota bacterium]